MPPQLNEQLAVALTDGNLEHLAGMPAADERDLLLTLLQIYELALGPTDQMDGRARFEHHPVVNEMKWRFEQWLVDALDVRLGAAPTLGSDVAADVRRVATQCNDSVYDWLAAAADWHQLVTFLAVEGGPDAGFDDLVALCQVGVHGPAKVVLGANYWDEMGCGEPSAVHTTLHDRFVAALDLPAIPQSAQPLSALFRAALNGLLATNRWLQPEMLGALALTELQAGPRCRRVLQAFRRLDAPSEAYPFYEEHARTDPVHAKEWLEGALRPIVEQQPTWLPRIVRGTRWRADVNNRLFRDLHTLLATREPLAV
ncbi:MAG TPA: iron-containing redox enzyme family protein [Acidimicrobiales bacterium]|nr:iron-containing redox enzyme family protein [Acidimicrobiales bacterium]